MDAEMMGEIDAMPPDIDDLAERVADLEYKVSGAASELAKIGEIEDRVRRMAEDIRNLLDAVNTQR